MLKKNEMAPDARKDFDKEAALWDTNPGRVKLAGDVAAAIIREIHPSSDMKVLDFGCGTGLLTLKLQPLVKSITGADSSPGMLGVLKDKIGTRGLSNVDTRRRSHAGIPRIPAQAPPSGLPLTRRTPAVARIA